MDWKTVREWAPTVGLVIALLILLALLKGIRRDEKRGGLKMDDCIRHHFAGQPEGQNYDLEDIVENLSTAPEVAPT